MRFVSIRICAVKERSGKRWRRGGAEGDQYLLRQIGRGREFEKLREYVAGDGLDEIHWKAAARRGRPITKVFQVERTQEIYVIIDASRLSARTMGEETALEREVAGALLTGAAAERAGDLFGLAAFSDRVEGVHAGACAAGKLALRGLPRRDLSTAAAECLARF